MPIGIKDNFATQALETCANSKMLAGNVPSEDADAVQQLRSAGALVLGKTAMTVFAAMDPAPTRNPWNGDHTPGGSSSGSAAAVAARMCAAALGSQTAGSVLRPAAYCGLVGLKPTYGAVSRKGLIPCAWSMDHVGALARSVEDAEILLGALATRAPAANNVGDAAVTIGVPDRYFFDAMDADVGAAFEEAIALLSGAGARVVTVPLPRGFEALVEAGIVTMYAEMAAYHRERFARARGRVSATPFGTGRGRTSNRRRRLSAGAANPPPGNGRAFAHVGGSDRAGHAYHTSSGSCRAGQHR